MGKSSIDINNYYDEEVVVHIEDDVIFVYRDSDFFRVSSDVEKYIRSLNITPLEKRYLTRKFFSNSYPDKVSKRGELRIDDSFLKNIAVDGNIYVTHKDNKVEIHGKKR